MNREEYYQGAADNWNEVPYSFAWHPDRRRGYEDAILIAPIEFDDGGRPAVLEDPDGLMENDHEAR